MNWKTTAAAIAILVTLGGKLIAGEKLGVSDVMAACAAAGLFNAKDHDK